MLKFWEHDGFSRNDYVVLFFFLIVLLVLPFIIAYVKRSEHMLAITFAGRNLRFFMMASAMAISRRGFAELSGVSGWAVRSGLGIYAFSLLSAVAFIILGWVFMPVYMASGSLTTIDYAKKRFGGKRIEIVMVILMLIINLVTKVATELRAANLMLMRLYSVPAGIVYSGLLLGSVSLVSTGGLFSLVYTSIWQIVSFSMGMPVVFLFSYWSFSSWEEITVKYQRSWPQTTIDHVTNSTGYAYTKCGIPDVSSLDLIRPSNDPVLPWPGMLFGNFIVFIYTHCIDQSILQFCLCGKSIVHVKYACILSGFFAVLTIFMIVPGFIARILFTDTVACADPEECEEICGKRQGCNDLALPLILQKVVPPGWRGLVLAAFLSASLASTAATLHAGSTVFTFNVYRHFRPRAREIELSLIGKMAILTQGVLGLSIVLFIDNLSAMHVFISRVYSSLVPPLVAVYLIGIFWKHVTEAIAFHTLVIGSCFAFTRLIWLEYHGTVPCGDESKYLIPDILEYFHGLHFAIFLFVICCSFIIIRGMTTEPINDLHLHRLIYWLRHSRHDRVDINERKKSWHLKKKKHKRDKGNVTSVNSKETELDPGSDSVDVSESIGTESSNSREDSSVKERTGCFRTYGACSNLEITDDLLKKSMKEKTSIHEFPRQTYTLNMMLIMLLLVITFVMAFFT